MSKKVLVLLLAISSLLAVSSVMALSSVLAFSGANVQAGKPTVLRVTNEDQTSEEFDSSALKVEKIIPPGRYATIRLRPLGPGRYPFMGEFHPETASGVVISE